MQLAAYKQAIDKLVASLAKDKTVIDAITEKVGETTVANAVKKASDELKATIDANKEEANNRFTEIDEKVTANANEIADIKGSLEDTVRDKIAVTSGGVTTSFSLTKTPSVAPVEMIINHLTYFENEDFTVDRATNTVTWTNTSAVGGFDIDQSLTDVILFKYSTVSSANLTSLYDDNFTPTDGQVDFILTKTPANNTNIQLFINGIKYPKSTFTYNSDTKVLTWKADENFSLEAKDSVTITYSAL